MNNKPFKKTPLILAFELGVFGWTMIALNAASVITARDITKYAFDDWSSLSTFQVPSSEGKMQIIKRTCNITTTLATGSKVHSLVLLAIPGSKELWIGPPPQHCAVIEGKIWALNSRGPNLNIKLSETTQEAQNGEEQIILGFLARFLEDCNPEWWEEGNGKYFDLDAIYGGKTISGTSSQPPAKFFDIREVSVNANIAAVLMHTMAGRDVSLSIRSDLLVVAAAIENISIPVLFNNYREDPLVSYWPPLFNGKVNSSNGKLDALICNRNYYNTDVDGVESLLATAKAVVLINNGRCWIGSSECKNVVFGREILGLLVDDDSKELLLFKDRGRHIPFSSESSSVFKSELKRFEDGIKEQGFRFKPDVKIDLRMLFSSSGLFPVGPSFSFREILIKEGELTVILNSGNPQKHPEIKINSNMSVISTQIIDRASGS